MSKNFVISLHPFSWKIWRNNSTHRSWNNGRASTCYHGPNDRRRNCIKLFLFYRKYLFVTLFISKNKYNICQFQKRNLSRSKSIFGKSLRGGLNWFIKHGYLRGFLHIERYPRSRRIFESSWYGPNSPSQTVSHLFISKCDIFCSGMLVLVKQQQKWNRLSKKPKLSSRGWCQSKHLQRYSRNYNLFRFENDTLIAEAKREYDLRKAANDQEVQTQKAISDLARALQGIVTKKTLTPGTLYLV